MTRIADIAQAVSLGVDAIGIIFYQKSSRYVRVSEAKSLLRNLPPFINAVAVFVNPEISLVQQVIGDLPIQWLQFHGDESPEFCEQFGKPFIKAVPAISTAAIMAAVTKYPKAGAILLDTPSEQRGGSGVSFDWSIIPRQLPTPLILAGGLNADNVKAAITASRPYAVDVCSSIEAAAGIKDHDKMSQFINVINISD